MIRVTLCFLNSNNNRSVDSVDTHTCEKVVELIENNVYEVWLRCFSPWDVLAFVEDALNKGLILTEVEFLNGLRRKGYQLNLEELAMFGQYDSELGKGAIVVKYLKQPSEWLGILRLKMCRIDVEKKQALIKLAKPVKVSILFDHGLKLLSKNEKT
ncbi:MAG: hypothetical protein QXN35_02965 [Ignisphaera sp.]